MTQLNSAAKRFDTLGVDKRVLSALQSNNFIHPTPIQYQCIPEAIKGKDIVGIAQTGTGKTLAFVVPIIQQLIKGKDQALIVAPTRELAIQANEMFGKIGKQLGFRTALLVGGAPIHYQIKDIRKNPDVIVATPGRLIDHLNRKVFNLNKIKIAVIDEADHMLDIGFLPDVQKILSMTPTSRQTLLFSATMPPAIVQIISSFMKMPVRIEIAPSGTVAEGIKQELFILQKPSKMLLLEKILNENEGKVLIFLRTKAMVKKVTEKLNNMNHPATEIHSDRSLPQRRKALDAFKNGKYKILVATDIAARGIDVSGISLVINYDLPQNSEDYVHRIGRTARAGLTGKAISFVTPDQKRNIVQIERLMKKNISVIKLPSLAGTGKSYTENNYKSPEYKKVYSKKSPSKNFYKKSNKPSSSFFTHKKNQNYKKKR